MEKYSYIVKVVECRKHIVTIIIEVDTRIYIRIDKNIFKKLTKKICNERFLHIIEHDINLITVMELYNKSTLLKTICIK
jgi:hypothetical protein